MGLLIGLIKIGLSVFPFLSELFLLSARNKAQNKKVTIGQFEIPDKWKPYIRRLVIVVGLLSFLLAIFLSRRLWDVSVELERLRKSQIVIAQPAEQSKTQLPKAQEQTPAPETTKPPPNEQAQIRAEDEKTQKTFIPRNNHFESKTKRSKAVSSSDEEQAVKQLRAIQKTYDH